MSTVDDYLAGLDGPAREALGRVRDLALEVVPDAEAGTSYGLAALRHHGKPLLGFQSTARHLSVYPFSPSAIDTVRGRLQGFEVSKGTIRFTAGHPLPDDVVRDLVRARVAEIDGVAGR